MEPRTHHGRPGLRHSAPSFPAPEHQDPGRGPSPCRHRREPTNRYPAADTVVAVARQEQDRLRRTWLDSPNPALTPTQHRSPRPRWRARRNMASPVAPTPLWVISTCGTCLLGNGDGHGGHAVEEDGVDVAVVHLSEEELSARWPWPRSARRYRFLSQPGAGGSYGEENTRNFRLHSWDGTECSWLTNTPGTVVSSDAVWPGAKLHWRGSVDDGGGGPARPSSLPPGQSLEVEVVLTYNMRRGPFGPDGASSGAAIGAPGVPVC